MTRKIASALVLMMLLLAMPLGAAGWKGRGFYEPDTARDVASGMMYLDPDVSENQAVRRVYFSAYTSQYGYAAGTIGNPNSAELGSAILAYPTDIHAILGVWKDCNEDGYIGMGPEGVLGAYHVALLAEDDVCPPQAADPSSPTFRPVHNDGTWVRELFPIGPDFLRAGLGSSPEPNDPQYNTNPWNIADETARVWADWNLPEDRTYATCIALPYSRDNLESTGGFLRYADCIVGWKITTTMTDVGKLTGVDGLRWDDAPRERPDESKSLANVDNPYGRESDASYATVWNCDATTDVPDPTGQLGDENGNLVTGPGLAPGNPNPSGSAAGTINETEEGIPGWEDCDRMHDEGSSTGSTGYFAHDLIDTGQEASPAARRNTDWWFEFDEGSTGVCLSQSGALGNVCRLTKGTPPGAGAHGANDQRFAGSWYGLPGFVASRNPFVNRDNFEPWGASYLTAYAYVDASAIGVQLAVGSAKATYGSDHCDGAVATTGWFECDAALWNVKPDGSSIHRPYMVKVGQSYNLLDIDCWDHSAFKGSPVTLSLVGANECVRP